MEIIKLYQSLSDLTRLRIVNLLMRNSLCVCHIQQVLDESQVKVSKHLSYMKERGIVTAVRKGNWMLYSLSDQFAPLQIHLESLKNSFLQDQLFNEDAKRLVKVVEGENRC